MIEATTRTEAYFIERYRASTLQTAVERAARELRLASLPGLEDNARVPVDVDAIARRCGILVKTGDPVLHSRDASLLPTRDAFLVNLRDSTSPARRRLSLAHEIGHTLFFEDTDSGPRHELGLLSKRELAAEERICDKFAGALLMPLATIRDFFLAHDPDSPWALLRALDLAARRFRVSIPALLHRLVQSRLLGSPFVVVYLRWTKNRSTGSDPRLRVQRSFSFGRPACAIWANRSASGARLHSAQALFDQWSLEDPSAGTFTWAPSTGLVRWKEENELLHPEKPEVSILCDGTWRQSEPEMSAASVLYARKEGEKSEAYVVSVLSH